MSNIGIYYCCSENCKRKEDCYRYMELKQNPNYPNATLYSSCQENSLFIPLEKRGEVNKNE